MSRSDGACRMAKSIAPSDLQIFNPEFAFPCYLPVFPFLSLRFSGGQHQCRSNACTALNFRPLHRSRGGEPAAPRLPVDPTANPQGLLTAPVLRSRRFLLWGPTGGKDFIRGELGSLPHDFVNQPKGFSVNGVGGTRRDMSRPGTYLLVIMSYWGF
jgi:hypothetical protein